MEKKKLLSSLAKNIGFIVNLNLLPLGSTDKTLTRMVLPSLYYLDNKVEFNCCCTPISLMFKESMRPLTEGERET